MMQELNKFVSKARLVLLPVLLSAPLLACATDDAAPGGNVVYRYPPANLLVVGPDPTKPTLEQLRGPDGDQYSAKYILDLELSGMTRGQALRCLQVWRSTQEALDQGLKPSDDPPSYCVFEEAK